ncbi:MAG: PspC domain-containing protein [Actinomycetota bacterium]
MDETPAAADLPDDDLPGRPRLARRANRRWIAGVAGGIADHVGVPPWIVRLGFVVATPIGGMGPILYGFLWWLLPRSDLPESAAQRTARRFPQAPVWAGVALVAAGVLLFAGQLDWINPPVVLALALIGIGVLLYLRDPPRRDVGGSPVQTGPPERPTGATLGDPAGRSTLETDLPPASLPAAREPRERSFLGPLTLGVGLLIVACGASLDLAGIISLSVAQAAALLLLVLGVGLAIGAFIGRARWLVFPALVLAPFALVLTVLAIDLDDGTGDRTVALRTLDEPLERRLAAGEMTIDLTHLRPGESGSIRAHVGVGSITLDVPDDLTLELTGQVGVGGTQNLYSHLDREGNHACCRFQLERTGFALPVRWVPGPRDDRTPGVVRIEATVAIGAIRINHVDRSNVR